MSDTSSKILFDREGSYGRSNVVKLETATCMECSIEKVCLTFDASDEEYSVLQFCIGCLNKFSDGQVSRFGPDNYFISRGNSAFS